MDLKNKNILLGVTGGIAAYKAPGIVSILKKNGANVKVVMTESATEFVTPLTFQTMSNNVVHYKMFEQLSNMDVEHISLAKWADMIVVAPASANTIAKFATGIADNLLTTVLSASRSKVMIVPAMNTYMLNSEANIENMSKLKNRGVIVTQTQHDLLACNDIGDGKMLEPSQIVDLIDFHLAEKDLEGYNFVITAGPTQESIDPVRFISNHSSGKMGYELAKAATKRGAKVILISGPTNLTRPNVDKFVQVFSTQDMYNAVEEHFKKTDVLIKAAAPADFKPKNYSKDKLKKADANMNSIELVPNTDIAKHFGSIKTNQIIVGFAAESRDELNYGLKKLESKNFDMIVINNITQENAGFKKDINTVKIVDRNKNITDPGTMSKEQLSHVILDKVLEFLKAR
ncbi:MAG: bifunctional phosphopantothenoylcysteine decarboxylase/phosphopantothenate--cysteine ligase CoaBC [Peptoniphilus sp.]|uniref:bifunctional phosphopantothenoylcysteine decarboxylase/phosphopantothenate--cysteine ligase CoaBC n=1 Tax=Peptoniphilus sp. TaxID=1971214 RepID=UPI002A749B1D|nr:bifunctional phosphopantothenoylcysteine decarboxylase/phosphopantothenate--cysteine ligase CoaBC [Peptoniphilus sp.]MDY2986222.1 bifunctional phosphopantothenoylcysteine decarboxylase/phosphopantothenate--cysteine ligase CoaBC [Peptoniphilus sp.]